MQNNLLDSILAESMLSGKGASKQKKILETAIELFAEKGFSNVSTCEISKAAGIAEGTLFRYYKTKDALLEAILTPCKYNMIPKISGDFMQIIKLQSFDSYTGILRFIFKNRIAFLRENRQIFIVFIKEALYRDDFRAECFPQINKEVFEFAESILNAAKTNNEIVNLPNEVLLRMIGTMIGGYFIARFIVLPDKMFLSDEEEAELLINTIINGIGTKKP